MTLIRTFARVGSEGSIRLPRNIRIALGLKDKDVVELKVVGASKVKNLMLSKRRHFR